MRRWVLSVLIAISTGPTVLGTASRAPAQAENADPQPRLRQAIADLNAGRVYEAVEGFRWVAREDPSMPTAHFYLATIYTAMGEHARARVFLERAREADLEEGAFHYQLGVIEHREGDLPAALTSLNEALRLGFETSEGAVWREIGDVQVELLEWDQAAEAYANALQVEPRDAKARLAISRIHYDRNETERAARELRQVLEIDSTLAEAYRVLGLAYRRLGDLDASISTLGEGVERHPTDQALRYALAHSLFAAARTDEAQSEMEEYGRIVDAMYRAREALDRGTERFESGDLSEARRLLTTALRLAPGWYEAQNMLGAVLVEMGDAEEAVTVLAGAVNRNPLSAEAYFNLGRAYLQIGRTEQALEFTERATVIDPESPLYSEQLSELRRRGTAASRPPLEIPD